MHRCTADNDVRSQPAIVPRRTAAADLQEAACRSLAVRGLPLAGDDATVEFAVQSETRSIVDVDAACVAAFDVARLEPPAVAAVKNRIPGFGDIDARVMARETASQGDVLLVGHRCPDIVNATVGTQQLRGGDVAVGITHRAAGDIERCPGADDDVPTRLQGNPTADRREFGKIGQACADPAADVTQRRAFPGAGLVAAVLVLDPVYAGHRAVRERAANAFVDIDCGTAQP